MRLCVLLLACFGCAQPTLTKEALMDPSTCASCHPEHYREWSGSMHAYASEDPVFVAMNARGQRETGGTLGNFCVNCHAPMAARTGATTDGLNLKTLPKSMQGVTCYFCHTVDAVEGTHNNPLRLAGDGVLRGGVSDPVSNTAHQSAYSKLHDRDRLDSAAVCGSCHDIVTPGGVHLERTFKEWQGSLFAKDEPGLKLTCGGCHMPSRMAVAADAPGAEVRKVHDHSMPGVDVALTPFPEMEAQRRAIQSELDSAIGVRLCVTGMNIEVSVDNIAAGHGWPSGSNQDRRAWVEVVARDADGGVMFQSGVVGHDEAVIEHAGDPNLWLFSDQMFDASNRRVHMFWEATTVGSRQIPALASNMPSDPRFSEHVVRRQYFFPPAISAARITARVRIRPLGYEVIDDLVASGDLEPQVRSRIPTFDLAGSFREWRQSDGPRCIE